MKNECTFNTQEDNKDVSKGQVKLTKFHPNYYKCGTSPTTFIEMHKRFGSFAGKTNEEIKYIEDWIIKYIGANTFPNGEDTNVYDVHKL